MGDSIKKIKCILKKFIRCCGVLVISFFRITQTLLRGKRSGFSDETDKSVIILANGPSLNDIDLNQVADSGLEIACVNYFPIRHKEFFWKLKPKHLVLLDPLFFINDDENRRLFSLLEKVDWPMNILISQGNKLPISNPNFFVKSLNCSALKSHHMTRYLDWCYRKNLLTIGYQNVCCGALFYFIANRYKQIYLAGADMSEFKCLFVDEKNRIYGNYLHSYGMEDREYSTDVEQGEFCYLLEMYQCMFEQFYYLSYFARRQNVFVSNLSINSYIDVFEKKSMFKKEKT